MILTVITIFLILTVIFALGFALGYAFGYAFGYQSNPSCADEDGIFFDQEWML